MLSPARLLLLPRHLDGWAMMLVPFAVGVMRSLGDADHVPMAIAWLLACLAYRGWTDRPHTSDGSRAEPVAATGAARGGTSVGRLLPATVLATVLAAGVTLVFLLHRPDLAFWLPAPLVLAVVAAWMSRRGGPDSTTAAALAALAAGVVGACAYQAGYPGGGTIAAGWTAVVALEVAGCAAIVGMVFSRPARGRTMSVVVSAAWHLGWAFACLAVAWWSAHPPGLSGRGLTLLAVLFVGLAVRGFCVARTRVPTQLVVVGDVLAWVAFLTVAWRWT